MKRSSRSISLTAVPGATKYHFRRYSARTELGFVGPLIVTALYFLILKFYLWEKERNGIIPRRPVDAMGVCFAWADFEYLFSGLGEEGLRLRRWGGREWAPGCVRTYDEWSKSESCEREGFFDGLFTKLTIDHLAV